MSRFETSIPPDYFDRLYADDPDPWRFATSDYEREKYAATLDALGDRRFRAGLEVGCSIGVLTRQLAERCDALLSVDVAEDALAQARRRCADQPLVEFRRMRVPHDWPRDGGFDLILLSEVVYYLDRDDIADLAGRVGNSLAGDGVVLLVHWTGETHYPVSGDEAAEAFIAAAPFLTPSRQTRAPEYRLDFLARS